MSSKSRQDRDAAFAYSGYTIKRPRRKERKALVVDEILDPAEQCHVAMTAREPTDPYADLRDQKENRAPWVPLAESSARAAHLQRAARQGRCAAVGSVETFSALRCRGRTDPPC